MQHLSGTATNTSLYRVKGMNPMNRMESRIVLVPGHLVPMETSSIAAGGEERTGVQDGGNPPSPPDLLGIF